MDNVVRKRADVLICMILVATTILCSCRVVDSITNEINRKKEIETMAQQIMQCIVDENKEKLLTFFSSDIQRNHAQQIELELDRAFEFINGKIISYEYDSQGGGGETIDNGRTTFLDCTPRFCNVITDAGAKYEIWCAYTYICEKKPERVGVSLIEIKNVENYNDYIDIGFFYSHND